MPRISDHEVNLFTVAPNGEVKFDEFGDVSGFVAGAISIVDWDGDCGLSGVKSVLLYVSAINGAACASTVEKCSGGQGLDPGAGIQLDVYHEVLPSLALLWT